MRTDATRLFTGAGRLHMTPADLLARGLNLPPVQEPAYELQSGSTCAITGQSITRGYRVADMVTVATAEFLDGFRGGLHGYVSESAARCFRSANPRAGNPCARSHLVFEDGTYYGPLIARESSVAQGRACWSALVRSIWPERTGEQCLVLLTTDTKKRLWHKARVGALGSRTPVYLYDNATHEQQSVVTDWPRLLEILDLVERIYALGWPKIAIRESLLATMSAAQAAGIARTLAMERQLAPLRDLPEFRFATLIAQRPADYQPPAKPERRPRDTRTPLQPTLI